MEKKTIELKTSMFARKTYMVDQIACISINTLRIWLFAVALPLALLGAFALIDSAGDFYGWIVLAAALVLAILIFLRSGTVTTTGSTSDHSANKLFYVFVAEYLDIFGDENCLFVERTTATTRYAHVINPLNVATFTERPALAEFVLYALGAVSVLATFFDWSYWYALIPTALAMFGIGRLLSGKVVTITAIGGETHDVFVDRIAANSFIDELKQQINLRESSVIDTK